MNEEMKETITDMLDEEYSIPNDGKPEDMNSEWRAHESEPWIKPTTSHHGFNSDTYKRNYDRIFATKESLEPQPRLTKDGKPDKRQFNGQSVPVAPTHPWKKAWSKKRMQEI